jgi:creatinine amidohydrolase/Fe(II)-dependent formamide hydrolase-like protein
MTNSVTAVTGLAAFWLPARQRARTAASLMLLLGVAMQMPAWAAVSTSVQLEDLTSFELRERIAGGATTVLLPIGGTEQNGPHMALGKHNVRARLLASRIAQQLGDAIVAPVLAYVPEGSITPPTQHMRWAGTISIPDAAFEGLLAGAARSLRAHGFCHVVLLGEHGGYRASLDRVAATLNREWAAKSACRVHALPEYYRAATAGYAQALKAQGYSAAEIGTHAGLADTVLTLALDPGLVRTDRLAQAAAAQHPDNGVAGDPAKATAELGRAGVDLIVRSTVAAVHAATHAAKPAAN